MPLGKPFHVVGHRVDGQPDKTRFSVMVNNHPLFRFKVPLTRSAAEGICTLLNGTERTCKWGEKVLFPAGDAE